MKLIAHLNDETQVLIRLGMSKVIMDEALKARPDHQAVLTARQWAPETFDRVIHAKRRGFLP